MQAAKRLLEQFDMCCVVETGARYLLDYRRKHHPTLVSASPDDRKRRREFLEHAIRVARFLKADCVSFWSGIPDDDASADELMERLIGELRPLIEYADEKKVNLAFEPEPGMFIDTIPMFVKMLNRLMPTSLRLALDVGHLHCQGETPIEDHITSLAPICDTMHIEDMRRGVHEHLMFGDGEMDFAAIVKALANSKYDGGVYVELSRHSHMGPEAARRAIEFLRPLANWK